MQPAQADARFAPAMRIRRFHQRTRSAAHVNVNLTGALALVEVCLHGRAGSVTWLPSSCETCRSRPDADRHCVAGPPLAKSAVLRKALARPSRQIVCIVILTNAIRHHG
jgi:hypothetical protein